MLPSAFLLFQKKPLCTILEQGDGWSCERLYASPLPVSTDSFPGLHVRALMASGTIATALRQHSFYRKSPEQTVLSSHPRQVRWLQEAGQFPVLISFRWHVSCSLKARRVTPGNRRSEPYPASFSSSSLLELKY